MQKKKTLFARFRQIFDKTSGAKNFQSHDSWHQGSEQKQHPARPGFCKIESEQVLKYKNVPFKTDTKYPSANHHHNHQYHF